MSSQVTPSGASGTGSQDLTFAMGKNQTRANKTYTFRASATNGNILSDNTLVITQVYAELAISASGQSQKETSQSSSQKTITFNGIANGAWLKCVPSSGMTSASITLACKEYSGASVSGYDVSSTYTQVNNFVGGTSTYEFAVTVTIPANTSIGNYSFTVYTADTNNPGAGEEQSVTFTVSVVAQAVAITSVTIAENPLIMGIGNANRVTLTPVLSPSNATIESYSWASDTQSVATVTSNGLVKGITEGYAGITLTVTDAYGTSKTGYCRVDVYAAGSMSASNITGVYSTSESASTNITLTNMDLSKAFTVSGSEAWILSGSVDTTNTPYIVSVNISRNYGDSSRTGTITVTGTDILGDTKTCTFTIEQTTSVVACTGMTMGGNTTISNSGNSSEYTAAYQPGSTTQTACTWSVSGSGSEYVSIDSSIPNKCTVTVLPGANNSEIVLTATNTYNSNISVSKTINVTYVAPPANIYSKDSGGNDYYYVTIAHDATIDDNTTGAPRITADNISADSLNIPSKAMGGCTGFIDTADLITVNGVTYVKTTFTANSSTSSTRTGSVVVHALDQGMQDVSTTIGYSQNVAPSNPNGLAIMGFNIAQVGGKVAAAFVVRYVNRTNFSSTFYVPRYTITGYDSNDIQTATVTLGPKTGNLSDVTVAANTSEDVSYDSTNYGELKWNGTLGMTVYYSIEINCGTLSDIYYGDGNDVI